MRRIVLLAIVVLVAPDLAAGAVLCARMKADGTFSAGVKIREACKDRETELLPDMVGWDCACPTATTTTTTVTTTTESTTTTTTDAPSTTSTTVPDVSGSWVFEGVATATNCPDVVPVGSPACGGGTCAFDVAQDGSTLDVHLQDTVPDFAGDVDVAAGTWTWGPCSYGRMTVSGFTAPATAVWDWFGCVPGCAYTFTGTVTRP
jgi:hypothetical protein